MPAEHLSGDGLPEHAVSAAAFAGKLAEQHADDFRPADMLAVFVGLVSSRDQALAAECLLAMEEAILRRPLAPGKHLT